MESSEYFVYCGLFIAKSWRKGSAQIAKGHFLEVAKEKEMTLDRVLSNISQGSFLFCLII